MQKIHRFLLHVLILADLCFSSRLYQAFLPDFGQRLLLSAMAIISILYLIISLIRGHVIPVMVAVTAVSLVIAQMLLFSYNFSTGITWNVAAPYSLFLIFLPIFIMSRDGMAVYIIKILSCYATVYTVLYLAITLSHHLGILPPNILYSLLMNDVERGDRLFAYFGALALAWFYSIGMIRAKFSLFRFSILMLCISANFLTLSRVYLICLVIVTALSLVRAPYLAIRVTCLTVLGIVSAILLYGVFDHNWNPFYTIAGNDTSGIGRGMEYQVVQDLLTERSLFGLGIPGESDLPAKVTGISFFSSGDLGAVGVLCDLGLVGLILFFISSTLACSYIHILNVNYAGYILLVGCTLSLYGTIAPVLFVPGGVFYFATILGMWLAQELRRTCTTTDVVCKKTSDFTDNAVKA